MIRLKTLVGEGIVFRTETRGAHHGQSDLTLYAEDETGEYMGHLDYSEYNGEPAVQMIKVKPNFRRSGIGTFLLKKLQTLYPDTEIELGMSTPEGTALNKSLSTVYVENPEYTRLAARLEKLKAADKKLQQWIDKHEGPMVPRVGDAFNRISDEMYDIEQKLSRMKPGKTLIKETDDPNDPYHSGKAGYIGVVLDSGEVDAIERPVDNVMQIDHSEIKHAFHGRWRYFFRGNVVKWTDEPLEGEVEAVNKWLDKKGVHPSKHIMYVNPSWRVGEHKIGGLKNLLLEKNLYHGTTAEKAKRIEKHGLIPQAGEFVSSAYDEVAEVEPLPELAFATEKKRLQVAVTAATQHIANEMGKGFHDVTDREFFNHAAILKFYDAEHQFDYRPEHDDNYYGKHPSTVEPGDYYTEHILVPDEILTGNAMIRLLRQNGCWPRDYMFQGTSDDHKRNMLIKHYIKKKPKYPKNAIIKRVMDLDHRDLNYWYEHDIKEYI